MNFYDDLVMQTQMNYSKYYHIYASGSTPYQLTDKKPLPYSEQINRLVQEVKEADCVVVGGASGLSAAGGGDFYYEDNDSYRKYFRPFAEKYHFKGAFAGMMHPWETREEYWGYLATFLHTTQTAPVRHPYLDLDVLLKGKDFFILTTNQDTQFVKLYPEEKVAEIQGDHRFFQCAACCTDDTWDAVKPVADMVAAMGDGTKIPTDLIPRCPHCGGEAFPWVRGYGNFLQGKVTLNGVASNQRKSMRSRATGLPCSAPAPATTPSIQVQRWPKNYRLPNRAAMCLQSWCRVVPGAEVPWTSTWARVRG